MASKVNSKSIWKDVLMAYCCEETKQIYKTISREAKHKMLIALQAVVESHNSDAASETLRDISATEYENENHIKRSLNTLLMSEYQVRKTDCLLSKAIESSGAQVMIRNFRELNDILQRWGQKVPRFLAMRVQEGNIYSLKQERSDNLSYLQSTNPSVRKKSSLYLDFSKLKKTFICDLKLFETATGHYLEGILITQPSILTGVTTFLEDENGDFTQLAIHNMVSTGSMKWQLVEQKFPKGLKIKISQPFYKIFNDGNRGIRVDSPADISFVKEEQTKSFDEIRSLGKELMKSGEELAALDLYFEGLKNFNNIAILLNNRAHTEIKMEEYEEALLDAAAAYLVLTKNEEAMERYQFAANTLGLRSDDKESIMCIWRCVLQHEKRRNIEVEYGSKEEGNEFFGKGYYIEANRSYTAAIRNSNICVLLNNIALVCLKLQILHTAVSACSAVLQISTSEEYNKKAHYSMAKAFSMMGELELAKLSAKNTDFGLEHFWSPDLNVEQTVRKLMRKCPYILNGDRNGIFELKDEKISSDYIKSNSIQHAFVKEKGRGLSALKNIEVADLLIVDHPVECAGDSAEEIVRSVNYETRYFYKGSNIRLTAKILNLVNYDGLLGKKILCLETQSKANEKLKLLDLEWMSYRKLNYEVPPFLPQSPDVITYDKNLLTESFVQNVLDINPFEWGLTEKNMMPNSITGVGLMLRISLLNHADEPNCIRIPLGNSMAIFAKRNICKGEELTICYREGSLQKWGL